MLVATSTSRTGLQAVFRGRFLRTFGKYSYGLYVVNQLFAFFPGAPRLRDMLTVHLHSRLASSLVFGGGGIGLSFATAWVSWHVLERRALKFKQHFEPERDTPAALSTAVGAGA